MERGRNGTVFLFLQGRRREREKWKEQGRHKGVGRRGGMYAWTGVATEEGEGRHDCTGVNSVHLQLQLIFIKIELFLMGFVSLDIFKGYTVR
jgi:hypothetical protein